MAHRSDPARTSGGSRAAIEFGTEVISVEDDPAGLRVTLKAGDRIEELTTAYVLARVAAIA